MLTTTMKKFALALLIVTLACVCGEGAAQATVTLTLTPSASTVPLGKAITLTATVSGSGNTGLTWSVNGVTNGNSTTGTLTGSGLKRTYTAPRVNCPSPNPVTFKIVSAANRAVSKAATVTVTDTIAVTLSPSSRSLPLGGTQAFTATISNTSNTALSWYVNGDRLRFSTPIQPPSLPRKTWGGRRRAVLSWEEEAAFLAPWAEQVRDAGVLVVLPLRAALAEGPPGDNARKSLRDIPVATFRSWDPPGKFFPEGYIKNGATGYFSKCSTRP